MRRIIPSPVTGWGPLASWANRLRDSQQGGTIIPGPGVRVQETPRGIAITVAPQGGGGAPTAPAKEYKLVSVQADYLTVTAWAGGANLYVAKDPKLRTSLLTATIFGVIHNYTYSAGPDGNNLLRTNTWNTGSEQELVIPAWLVGDMIYAIPATTGLKDPSNKAITLLEVRPARQWASL